MFLEIPDENLHVNCSLIEYQYFKDYEDRRLFLDSEIEGNGDGTISELKERIMNYNRDDKGIKPENRKPILLFINSPGGDVQEGFSLISFMALSKTPIYTVNIGLWGSMSFLIGIAGHKRLSLPNMTFLMHDGLSVAWGSTSKVQDQIEFSKRYDSEVVKKHVLQHSFMKECDYDALSRVELYMLPKDALEHGFIDEIITDIDTIL